MFGFGKKNKVEARVDERHINKIVDYTCISSTMTTKELEKKMCVAYKNKYYLVCVNPINVKFASEYAKLRLKGSIKIGTVIGFPLGETTTDVKLYEMKKAMADGAEEVDVMIALSRVKSGDFNYIKNEISRIVKASKKCIVKIIIETAVLTRQEMQRLSLICAKCKVDYIQTSSGFNKGGARIEDIEVIVDTVKDKCKVKASGGIENATQAIIMARAGAVRIGTSREI